MLKQTVSPGQISNILQNTKNTHSFERILTSKQHINITWWQDVLVYVGTVMH